LSLILEHGSYIKARRAMLISSVVVFSASVASKGTDVSMLPEIGKTIRTFDLGFFARLLLIYLVFNFIVRSGEVRLKEERIYSEFITGFAFPIGIAFLALIS